MIWVTSIVSSRTLEGMVNLQWDGKACQLSVQEARQLGMQLLKCAEAAEGDAGIFHILTKQAGVEEGIAYQVLQDLRKYRDAREKASLEK